MSRQTLSTVSIIPLLIGSLLMLASGFGLISSKYLFAAGLSSLVVWAFFEIISASHINKSQHR